MKTEIGSLTLVHSVQLILPVQEEGRIEFAIGSWIVRAKVRFESTPDADPQSLTIGVENDSAVLRFLNWNNSLGSATTKPVEFATLNTGAKVYFLAAQWRVGDVNVVVLQFLMRP